MTTAAPAAAILALARDPARTALMGEQTQLKTGILILDWSPLTRGSLSRSTTDCSRESAARPSSSPRDRRPMYLPWTCD